MEDIKRQEIGFSDYQKSRRRYPRKGFRESVPVEKPLEVMRVPTILKKGDHINQIFNKENGVSKEEINGSENSSTQWKSLQSSHQINPLAKEFTFKPKLKQQPTRTQSSEQGLQQADPQNYYQNYPQLLKKVSSVTEQASPVKEVVTKPVPPAVNSSANIVRAIEKNREYSSLWVPRVMKAPTKLISNFNWTSSVPDVLKEQCNYVVVGVLGAQSTGKSTLLSHLAGFPARAGNKMLFEPPAAESLTGHSTQGVDMYVTQERMILLDSQALFSMSSTAVMKKKKRFVGEKHHHLQDSADAQSLQLASFFLSVCNVVIVVIDWFIDDQIIKLLSIAEMLKPKASSNLDDVQNPHIVFALNRATEADWRASRKLNTFLGVLLSRDTLLRFTGMFTASEEGARRDKKDEEEEEEDVEEGEGSKCNLILLPEIGKGNGAKLNNNNTSTMLSALSLFALNPTSTPSYQQQTRLLRNTILSLPRDQMFNKLSERNWLQYAAKAWDLVRTSSFISDYSRLLS